MSIDKILQTTGCFIKMYPKIMLYFEMQIASMMKCFISHDCQLKFYFIPQ